MDLPSFLWLWRIAAWSMGFSILAYILLGISGLWIYNKRVNRKPSSNTIKLFHYGTGAILVFLVLLLLGIGIVGTLGHYGDLGHSQHLFAGLFVVVLVLISASSAIFISPQFPWLRSIHITTNFILLGGLIWVSITGWDVVQKYLP